MKSNKHKYKNIHNRITTTQTNTNERTTTTKLNNMKYIDETKK